MKAKAYVIRDGRPCKPMGAGRGAPQLTMRLDAEAEAALEALAIDCGRVVAAPSIAREAIVYRAQSVCPDAYDAALARVQKRRAAESQ